MQPLTLLAACFCQQTSLWVGSVFWLFLVWSTNLRSCSILEIWKLRLKVPGDTLVGMQD